MVELLVSIALMSVMTAVLLQSFIVARRLNARASTEIRLQSLAGTTMESMKAAELSLATLKETARNGGAVVIDGVTYRVSAQGEGVRLLCNDIGNGRGPVVSFGNQYGVYCDIDPAPYSERTRMLESAGGEGFVNSFNNRAALGFDDDTRLVRLDVVIYRMEEHLAKTGPEQLRLESARTVTGGGA